MTTIQARMPAAASEPLRTVPCHRGPTVPRLMLGSRLQRLRVAAGISTDLAGDAIRASRSKISRMENGRVGLKVRDVSDLLDLYGITDEKERAGMLALAQESGGHGWWSGFDDVMTDWLQEYIGLEAAASLIRTFELQFVNGLLQTEAYARAVTLFGYPNANRGEIDRRVDLRLRRQDRIANGGPPRVWSVIDEGALRRVLFGDPQVAKKFYRDNFAVAMDRLAEAWREVEDRYGFPLESPDVAARAVMGMALLLAMERHHGNAKKAERDATLAKISEGTVKGFFPAIEPGRRRR